MPSSKDTFTRLLTLVQLIPQAPRRISTTTLLEKLAERGFDVDARPIQLDLLMLVNSLSVTCHQEEKPYR